LKKKKRVRSGKEGRRVQRRKSDKSTMRMGGRSQVQTRKWGDSLPSTICGGLKANEAKKISVKKKRGKRTYR